MTPFYTNSSTTIYTGHCLDVLRALPDGSVQCAVTSPPYWGLRDYGVDGQIGLEKTPDEYAASMVEVFREVRRVLRDDGCVWLNLGDTYNAYNGNRGPSAGFSDGKNGRGHPAADRGLTCSTLKPKDRVMIPARVALALQADGYWLRDEIVWHKKSPMPSSVRDRTTSAHEMVYLLSKRARYFYDADAVKETADTAGKIGGFGGTVAAARAHGRQPSGNEKPEAGRNYVRPNGRNRRSVWTVATTPWKASHFATFPPALIEPMILAGTSERGCCPLCGAPWRRVVATERVTRERPRDRTSRHEAGDGVNACGNTVAGVATTTTGWQPTCDCEPHEPVPCVVLDPFLGSGTTAQVCRWLGRKCIGIELNEEYAEMAIKRANTPRDAGPRREELPGQMRLFGDK